MVKVDQAKKVLAETGTDLAWIDALSKSRMPVRKILKIWDLRDEAKRKQKGFN